ncbi:unnamed protein product [Rhizoctonia solani]|uniref:Uncharacterized protein n=1 Tax=Rhizoctonia solani TaxID=456999 RepID=A0A8H3ATJ7_9AGAM|nr:unnamed protein product [Rhizoctonia solani]
MISRRKLGNKQEEFDNWANKVGLLTGIRQLDDEKYQNTPEVCALETLLSEAKVAPKWLADLSSASYLCYQFGVYCGAASSLAEGVTRAGLKLSDCDVTLDVEVAQSTEADKRCHMNVLLSCLWDFQSSDMFHSQEHGIRVPEPVSAAPVIPDSSVFFMLAPKQFAGRTGRIVNGCLVVHPSNSSPSGKVLHWVTEYKRELGLKESRRQVHEALTSALYQRRALGFMDHFVFGTSHHNQTLLEVVAATWVSADDKADPAQPEPEPKPEPLKKADDAFPSIATEQNPDSKMDIDGAHDQVKTQGDLDKVKLVRDLKRRNKIAVYNLGTFDMQDSSSVLSYYLLMRNTRDLAIKYQKEITASSNIRSNYIYDANPKVFDWYNPPEPAEAVRVGPKSSSSVTSMQCNDNHYDSMDELDSDSYSLESDNESGPTLPSDSAIDETNWNELREKVHAFLASTLLVDSEEANDTATCEDDSGENIFQGEMQMI